jgi:hypothetical protein
VPDLRFNKKVYRKEAIEKAVCAYSHLATFRVNDRRDYTVVRIEGIGLGLKSIFCDEFANYVLGMNK